MSNLDLVKELRALTLAGMSDCRSALQESGGDMAKAVDRGMVMGDVHLLEKSGGKSGEWKA